MSFSPGSPEIHSPVSSAKFFLCIGQLTFRVPFSSSPTKPCDSTKARLCGHIFCVAYHLVRLCVLNTASCTSPYRMTSPPFSGKDSTREIFTHVLTFICVSGSLDNSDCSDSGNSLGQSAGRR